MRKPGDKKVIKNIVQRNLRSEKRRNVMLVISIALASFLICFSGLIATSLLEVQKKQIQDTYEAVYMNVSEEKLLKPQKEIYERLFEKFNIKPEESYFIDDLQLNIDGAAACGMKGYCFADGNVEKLQKALESLNKDS